jgi:outer membrane protein assembly factor BamD
VGFHGAVRISLIASSTVILAACGHGFRVKDYVTTESLMDASTAEFRRGHFSHARTGFMRVNFEVAATDSVGAVARYLTAECDYAQANYLEASRGFRRVADEFPDHPLAPDALMRAGDALSAMWNRPELDPTYGEEALAAYRELAARYPETRATARSQLKLAALSDRFAEKEFRAGMFYYRLKAFDSAIIYFRSVVAQYHDSRFAPQSMVMLVRTYLRLSYKEETKETCDAARQYYPTAKGLNEICSPAPSTP